MSLEKKKIYMKKYLSNMKNADNLMKTKDYDSLYNLFVENNTDFNTSIKIIKLIKDTYTKTQSYVLLQLLTDCLLALDISLYKNSSVLSFILGLDENIIKKFVSSITKDYIYIAVITYFIQNSKLDYVDYMISNIPKALAKNVYIKDFIDNIDVAYNNKLPDVVDMFMNKLQTIKTEDLTILQGNAYNIVTKQLTNLIDMKTSYPVLNESELKQVDIILENNSKRLSDTKKFIQLDITPLQYTLDNIDDFTEYIIKIGNKSDMFLACMFGILVLDKLNINKNPDKIKQYIFSISNILLDSENYQCLYEIYIALSTTSGLTYIKNILLKELQSIITEDVFILVRKMRSGDVLQLSSIEQLVDKLTEEELLNIVNTNLDVIYFNYELYDIFLNRA